MASLVAVAGGLLGLSGFSSTANAQSTEEQLTFLQLFDMEWLDVERRAVDIFKMRYNALWLPPPSLATDAFSVGYDVFDRFDLGQPPLSDFGDGRARTAFGTEASFASMIRELKRAGIQAHVDAVLNHNSGRTTSDAFFAAGGWPGFWVPRSTNQFGGFDNKQPTDDWGDFHAGVAGGYLQSENPNDPRYDLWEGDLVALVDIDQASNNQFIRHPIDPSDPDNIPAGTFRNRADALNGRFYPDLDASPREFVNPAGPDLAPMDGAADTVMQFPFTGVASPIDGTRSLPAGDPVLENAQGLVARWVRWMFEVHQVDGMRLDALKHTFPWWWDQFFDSAVFEARLLPDGRRVTPFTFGENATGNQDILNLYTRRDGFGNRDALDLNGAGQLRNLFGAAGGLGVWDNVLTSHLDATDDGFQNGSAGVFHVFSHDNGSLGDGTALPPVPNLRQQFLAAHAYLQLRPGKSIVYHNGRGVGRRDGFFAREGMPIALGWDPIAREVNGTMEVLNRIRREYARGWWYQLNPNDDADELVFQLAFPVDGTGQLVGDLLVGVSDRYDGGVTNTGTFFTAFPEGTRLVELTGNAANPAVDPFDELPDVITVGPNGAVNDFRVPRNVNGNGDEHNLGYVAYGPAVPNATLTIEDASGSVAPDPGIAPDAQQRVFGFEVVSGDSFTIRLDTQPGDSVDTTADDNALFKINNGFDDFNGNGQPDIDPLTPILGGFEEFTTERTPAMSREDRMGTYRQTIDTTQLKDGFYYINAIAFRQRTPGTTPLFRDLREVVYLDRVDGEMSLLNAAQPFQTSDPVLEIRTGDRTIQAVFTLVNVPDGTDPTTLISTGNRASRYDARDFRAPITGLVPGANTITLVGVEENLRLVTREFTVQFGTLAGCNAADIAEPVGVLNSSDINAFVSSFLSGDDRADVAQPLGVLNSSDINTFVNAFVSGCP